MVKETQHTNRPRQDGDRLVKRTLPAGTVVKIEGIPIALTKHTEIETAYGNLNLLHVDFVPHTGRSSRDGD